LQTTWTYSRLILENHSWSCDEVISNADEFGKKILFADVGIPFKKSLRNSNTRTCDQEDYQNEPEKCRGCMKNVLEVELIKLDCDHLFCADCWKSHIRSKLQDKNVTLQSFFPIRCPASKCGFILDEKKMELILNPMEMHAYKNRLLERFILTNPFLRLCPNNCCVVQTFEKRKEKLQKECHSVQCKCKIEFCFACRLKSNSNCSIKVKNIHSPTESPNSTESSEVANNRYLSESQKLRPFPKQLSVDFQSRTYPIRRRASHNASNGVLNEKEKKVLTPFYEMIAQRSDKVCYGLEDTIFAIELSAAKTVFIWKDIAVKIPIDPRSDKPLLSVYNDNSVEAYVEQVQKVRLIDWIKRNCERLNTQIELIEGQCEEGNKFCNGFGIAAILRYPLNSLPSKREEHDGLNYSFTNASMNAV